MHVLSSTRYTANAVTSATAVLTQSQHRDTCAYVYMYIHRQVQESMYMAYCLRLQMLAFNILLMETERGSLPIAI